jgi:hypothetical protein
MSMSDWATQEVKLACKKENPNYDFNSDEFDYGCSCYKSALKAYKSICEDEHSFMSYIFTKNILIRLLNELPLTPIEDTKDVWNEVCIDKHDGETSYQCVRKSSLFKCVHDNGKIEYHDNDRAYCIDMNTGNTYHDFPCHIVDELFPIKFPYYPSERQYKVYTKDFLAKGYYGDNGDYNTLLVSYIITPDGKNIPVNRYYGDSEKGGMEEISFEEYMKRYRIIVEKEILRDEI